MQLHLKIPEILIEYQSAHLLNRISGHRECVPFFCSVFKEALSCCCLIYLTYTAALFTKYQISYFTKKLAETLASLGSARKNYYFGKIHFQDDLHTINFRYTSLKTTAKNCVM